MGRFDKSVLIDNGIDRRELGYYSTPEFVADFMSEAMLEINPSGSTALDPCVGKEELIKGLYKKDIDIDGIDIYNYGDYYYCNYIQRDFIEFYKQQKINLLFDQQINLKYDYYIANPPYNCHEVDYIRSNKKGLSQLFGNIGVHNMYSMFISAIIDSAKDGALISIITSDSFLTAKMHASLRKQILNSCSVHYLVLCPTNLFWEQKADVRTVIMVLQKGKKYQKQVKSLNRTKRKEEFKLKLTEKQFIETPLENIISSSGNNQFEFVIDIPTEIQSLFSYPRIGELYKCITGISTGADAKYLSKDKKDGFEVPFYKNPGSRKFFCEADSFLTNDYLFYDREIKNFMVRNKGFMLKEGITCSSMGLPFSACYLPEGATCGVNANIFCDKRDIWWLIAYLNSSLVTYIVRGVLIRSNMITSGYVSKIPIVQFSPAIKDKLSLIAKEAYKKKVQPEDCNKYIEEIDNIVFEEIDFKQSITREIRHFALNLQSRV